MISRVDNTTDNKLLLLCSCGANITSQSWKLTDGLQCMICDRKNYTAFCNIHNLQYQGYCYICKWDALKPFDYVLYPEDFLWDE